MVEEKIVYLYAHSDTDFEGIRKIAEAVWKDWVGSVKHVLAHRSFVAYVNTYLKIYGLEVDHTCDTSGVNCCIPANNAIDQKSKFILAKLIKLNEDLHEVDEKIMWAEVFNSEVSYDDFKRFYKIKLKTKIIYIFFDKYIKGWVKEIYSFFPLLVRLNDGVLFKGIYTS